MTAVNQLCTVYRGNSATLSIDVTQADGTPLDLTLGAILKYRMATTSHALEENCLIKKELGNGLSVVPGGVSVTLSTLDTDFEPGIYYHTLKVFNAGDVSTAMVGAFVIRKTSRWGPFVRPASVSLNLVPSFPVKGPVIAPSSVGLSLARGTPSRAP